MKLQHDDPLNEELKEQPKEEPEKPMSTKEKYGISVKELLIILGALFVIFILIVGVPLLLKKEPKTLNELHIENFEAEESDTNYIYNSFSFLKLPDPRTNRMFWYTQLKIGNDIYDLPMHYGPREVENISIVVVNPTEKRDYSTMYITVDPKNESRPYLGLAVAELSEKFATVKKYPLESACTSNTSIGCWSRPIVDCENSEDDVVVKLEDDKEQPRVLIDGNCFIIQGNNESLIMATDKMIYKFLEII